MAAPFVVPFNNQPYSTEIKDTAYTVPAGYYARVIPIQNDLSIDTDSINMGPYTVSSGTATGSFTITPYYVYQFSWNLSGSGVDYYTVQGNNYGRIAPFNSSTGSALIIPTNASASQSVTYTGTPAEGAYSVQQWSFSMDQAFWVPTGTDLEGSRYIVELYPQIT